MKATGLERARLPVFVPEAQVLGMIGVIRSLGRAGYPVHAASADPTALGFRSRYSVAAVTHPEYRDPEFVPWLRRYCAQHGIRAIVPSEGLLHALAGEHDQWMALLPDATDVETVRRCMSKVAVFQHLAQRADTRAHQPPGGVLYSIAELPSAAALAPLMRPFYVKSDAGLARDGAAGAVVSCPDAVALRRMAEEALARHTAILWQAHVPGSQVGVSLWRHRGAFRAEHMVLGLHQRPHTGGMMSLRRSFWHDAILADAKRKLEALNWDGVAMMEYKWDPASDDFWFIEVNARYWAYLHLDLYAGKDFPRLQLDGFFGLEASDLGPSRGVVTCRHTLPGEWSWLLSRWRDPALSLGARLASVAEFGLRFLQPGVRGDLLFPDDRRLYLIEAGRFLRQTLGRR